jgi:DNA-nicking Smr family endonuclease
MSGRKTGSSTNPPDPAPDDDLALWRHVTRDTRPLAKRPAVPKPETPAERTPPPAAEPKTAAKPKAATKPKGAAKPAQPAAPPPPNVPALEKGAVIGVDKRTAGRLKRGKLPVEGRLDLHGLSQNEAERALAAFLTRSQDRGHRCVLVITGKGGERRGEDFERTGVLRRMVPLWLNAPANRARILAFDEARAQHGGAGALYVLLKRAKGDDQRP